MAGKNMRRRRRRVYEASSRERIRAFLGALFRRRGEQTAIVIPPDEPPPADAGVVAVPLGPSPSAGSAEATPDPADT